MVVAEYLSNELTDPMLFGHVRQPLDKYRPEALVMEVISDLDRDFGARLVELGIDSMSDERTRHVLGEQPVPVTSFTRRPVSGINHIDPTSKEP
jgi:hypothetical protein